MGEENFKKYSWTSGRATNMERRTNQELRELYKNLDIADIKTEKTGMEWTCSKDGSGKDS